jgi:carbonic anhydrase/acetyltransferase-like protein (isoleucine patch superfamily)
VAPSTRVVAWQGKELRHGLQAFIAPTATVIGDVSLGEKSSVWYSAVVRGVSPHSFSRCPAGAIVRRSTVDGVVVVALQARARR